MRDTTSPGLRSLVRRVEVAASVLTLSLTATFVVPGVDPTFGTDSVWLTLGVPTILATAALVGASIDGLGTVRRDQSESAGRPRLETAGRTAVIVAVVGLSAVVLWWAFNTAGTVLFGPGGGVLFGPVVVLFSGSVLSGVLLCRGAVRLFYRRPENSL